MRRISSLVTGSPSDSNIDIPNIVPHVETYDGYPYIVEERLSGLVYIFLNDYIKLLELALSTDCLVQMDNKEKELTNAFVNWLYTNENDSLFEDEILLSLDITIMSLVSCARIPSSSDCGLTDTTDYSGCQ